VWEYQSFIPGVYEEYEKHSVPCETRNCRTQSDKVTLWHSCVILRLLGSWQVLYNTDETSSGPPPVAGEGISDFAAFCADNTEYVSLFGVTCN
jgi:hypothetical protein